MIMSVAEAQKATSDGQIRIEEERIRREAAREAGTQVFYESLGRLVDGPFGPRLNEWIQEAADAGKSHLYVNWHVINDFLKSIGFEMRHLYPVGSEYPVINASSDFYRRNWEELGFDRVPEWDCDDECPPEYLPYFHVAFSQVIAEKLSEAGYDAHSQVSYGLKPGCSVKKVFKGSISVGWLGTSDVDNLLTT